MCCLFAIVSSDISDEVDFHRLTAWTIELVSGNDSQYFSVMLGKHRQISVLTPSVIIQILTV